jgi:protein-S-isoprenylcysteine O-methyltransferase Ste14
MKATYILKQFIGTLIFFTILFISAGRINYCQGWVYVSIGIIMSVLSFTVLRIDADLARERAKPGADTKKWDKGILGLSFLATLAMYTVAGLDSGRYHWSPEFHWSLMLAGGILTAAGQLLFLVAQKQNRFFSSTVRIQTERNHSVCDTGVYKFVRHPAYLGSVIQAAGFPLLFGSVWSIFPVALLIILFVVRTSLEDKTLVNELAGYREYTGVTKFRLIPGVW